MSLSQALNQFAQNLGRYQLQILTLLSVKRKLNIVYTEDM